MFLVNTVIMVDGLSYFIPGSFSFFQWNICRSSVPCLTMMCQPGKEGPPADGGMKSFQEARKKANLKRRISCTKYVYNLCLDFNMLIYRCQLSLNINQRHKIYCKIACNDYKNKHPMLF